MNLFLANLLLNILNCIGRQLLVLMDDPKNILHPDILPEKVQQKKLWLIDTVNTVNNTYTGLNKYGKSQTNEESNNHRKQHKQSNRIYLNPDNKRFIFQKELGINAIVGRVK